MRELLNTIISTYSFRNDPILALRSDLIGCRIDASHLSDLGYHKRDDNAASWNEWTKSYYRGTECVSFIISAHGLIGAIDTKKFYDTQDIGGFEAPFGYVRTNNLSSTMYQKLRRNSSLWWLKKSRHLNQKCMTCILTLGL